MNKQLASALFLFAASGCVNYTALTDIEPDGSGFVSIIVEVPLMEDAGMSITDFGVADSTPGWELTFMSTDTLDTAVVYRLEGNFKNPGILEDVFDIDNMTFEKEESGDVIRYHLSRPPVYMPASKFEGVFQSTGSMLKTAVKHGTDKYTWIEKLVLPGKIVEHNANKQKKDTLIWKVDIGDLTREGFLIDVTWEVPK